MKNEDKTSGRTKLKECYHGGKYSVNASLVRIDFSSSVSPLGMPKNAINAALKNHRETFSSYPDPLCTSLNKRLCDYLCKDSYSIESNWINVGNGATELIYNFARAFIKPGCKVVIPFPTFCEYESASMMQGVDPFFVGLSENMKVDANSIIDATGKNSVVFLCNPNNPTGLLSSNSIRKIIDSIDSSNMIFLDECFIELVSKPHENSLVSRADRYENLFILRSLTKSFGMAGLRLGYAISNPKIALLVDSYRIPWNVNGIAQIAGAAALGNASYLLRARSIIERERKFMFESIEKLDKFIPLNSDVNFYLIKTEINSKNLQNSLLENYGILVRDCSTFKGMGENFIRVSVKTHKNNMLLLRALAEAEKIN